MGIKQSQDKPMHYINFYIKGVGNFYCTVDKCDKNFIEWLNTASEDDIKKVLSHASVRYS